ncbi:NADPH:quinone reductase-like Zn-dependent oxidoreductase [Streptomyces phaeochromogenes]|uniref:NADP-dependent oxidoreductase n=1 Tax=Streptomyces phaeochromogenes TaxID=1923 RepID=UPI002791041A|nr:NADP-dependent oxidoreductase [Streptomyces phaeochromogenes]MDQ0949455.1 NADPH:quinone reductase-like Zn-dependent oxidoreductase [Streptomyces phaeochromogenes]
MTTALPRTRVITQHRFGGPEVLEIEERERPVAGPGEILLRVRAVGVNAVDRLVRSGAAPLFGEPPFVLGGDVSGVVEAAGAGVTRFRPGDEVFGKVLGGGYAEHVAAPADQFAAKPSTLDHVHAAAAPTATLTAWQALVDLAQVGPGTRVLVHAAGGGVGHAAVQIAKAEGAYVVGTARADKHEFLRDLGVDEPVDHTDTDFATAVRDMDVALDLIGGDYGPRTLGTLRPGGLLLSALPGDTGLSAEDVEARGMRFAVVRVEPSGMRLAKIASLLAGGRVRIHVDAVLPFAEAAKAHEVGEAGHTKGKIVLSLPE